MAFKSFSGWIDKGKETVSRVKDTLTSAARGTGSRPNGSTLGLTTGTTIGGNTASGPSGGRADTYSTVNSRGQTTASQPANVGAGTKAPAKSATSGGLMDKFGGGGSNSGSPGNSGGSKSSGSAPAGNPKGGGTNTNDPSHYKKGGLVKKRGWGEARTFKK